MLPSPGYANALHTPDGWYDLKILGLVVRGEGTVVARINEEENCEAAGYV
jgi:hypothetical protein